MMAIKITEAEYIDATFGLGNPGYCLDCGTEADGCEPDARNYTCEACGKNEVYGLEECLMMGAVEFI